MTTASPHPSFKKGYKYRIYPTDEQKILLEKTFGCCRYVYNRALAESKEAYTTFKLNGMEASKPAVTGNDFVKLLPLYKQDPSSLWLNEVSSCALQQVMLQLGRAYQDFFSLKKGFPNFKSKRDRQSFTLIGGSQGGNFFRITSDQKLKLGRINSPIQIEWQRDKKRRALPSAPSKLTVSRTPTGKYYVSFLCEYVPVQVRGAGRIGIDYGVKDFVVTSDGLKIENPKYLTNKQKQLRRAQQSLARKKKGSRNRENARLRVARIHERITDTRNDFLHKLSRKLINENQVIGLETLKISNMVRNRRLSKAIMDTGWSMFVQMLIYKRLASRWGVNVHCGQYYPSTHICSKCAIKLDYKLKLAERTWSCPNCKTLHDRDVNAACNILQESLEIAGRFDAHERSGGAVLVRQ